MSPRRATGKSVLPGALASASASTKLTTLALLATIAPLIVLGTGCGVVFPSAGTNHTTVPSEPTMINFVDPAQVAGLASATISEHDPRVFISYPTITSAPILNASLHASLSRLLRQQKGALKANSGELNVDWKLTAASGDVVGVRLRTAKFSGGRWDMSYRTVWYDRTVGRVHDSPSLLHDQNALVQLAAIAGRLAAAKWPGVNAGIVMPNAKTFDALTFNSRGDLVVEFDDSQLATQPEGRRAVAVPRGQADPLLSEFGRRAQAAVKAVTVTSSFTAPAVRPPPSAKALTTVTDCAKSKCIALTFANGPGPNTSALLDTLADDHARATFFTVGENAVAQPYLLRRMRDGGSAIINHTWSHRDLTKLSSNEITDQIARGQEAISYATGFAPAMILLPYDAKDARVTAIARQLGLTIIRTTLVTDDTTTGDTSKTGDPTGLVKKVIDAAKRDAILQLNDAGRATVAALPQVLTALREQGYVFVTVPELHATGRVSPGGMDSHIREQSLT